MEIRIRAMFTKYFIGHVHVLYSLAVLSNDSVYIYTILDLSLCIWLIPQINKLHVQDICYILRQHLECLYNGRREVDCTLHYAGSCQINIDPMHKWLPLNYSFVRI